MYAGDAVTNWTCQKWLAKFCVGYFSLDDAPWLGRPVEIDSNQIDVLIENDPCYTMQETCDILKISKSTIENHLHKPGHVNCFDGWVLHKLSQRDFLDRISACNFLLKHNKNLLFLKHIVIGDERWVFYNNAELKRSWGKENKHQQPHQRSIFIQRGWCVYGRVGRDSSIMSSFQKTNQLIPTSTAPN